MYGFEHKVLSIFISFGLLFQSYVIRSFVGSYLHPAALLSLVWFLYTIFPLLFMFDAPINSLSIFFIFLCTFAFSVGVVPFNWKEAYKFNAFSRANFYHNFNSNFMLFCLITSSGLALFFTTLTMLFNGWSIEAMLTDLLYVSGRYAALRGNEGVEYGLVGVLGVTFTYLSSVVGGLISTSQPAGKGKFWYPLISILPALYAMVIQSSKLIFLVATSFYIASLLLGKVYKSDLIIFKRKVLLKIFFVVLMILPFILFSFISREGYSDFDNMEKTISMLKFAIYSYLFGQIYAFSDFFSFYVGMDAQSIYVSDFYSFGQYTFSSIYQTLGFSKEFPPGTYLETGYYSDLYETNVFTVFRGLIYDFGIFGTILLFFIFGVIVNFSFYKLLYNKRSSFLSVLFIVFIVFNILAYLISVFMARYMYLNALLIWLILVVNDKIYSPKNSRMDKN
jgi:oligosaccharide repeat unit polymerase